jgi:hypothetical protein
MIERKVEVNNRKKTVYYYWGLTWPTLIVGAITVMSVSGGLLYLIFKFALVATTSDSDF